MPTASRRPRAARARPRRSPPPSPPQPSGSEAARPDRMIPLVGRISIIGRLSAPRAVVAREVAARGGTLQRGLSRQAGVLVVARASVRQLANGQLRTKIVQADLQGVVCVSEATFLRALGLLPEAAPVAGAVALDALPHKAGLEPEVVRFLVLFGLIEPSAGQCSFRD